MRNGPTRWGSPKFLFWVLLISMGRAFRSRTYHHSLKMCHMWYITMQKYQNFQQVPETSWDEVLKWKSLLWYLILRHLPKMKVIKTTPVCEVISPSHPDIKTRSHINQKRLNWCIVPKILEKVNMTICHSI